jgi:Single-strand binding protein family
MTASNLNRVVLTANLTKDPDLRTTQNGTSVCSLRVACNALRQNTDCSSATARCPRSATARHSLGRRLVPWPHRCRHVAGVGPFSRESVCPLRGPRTCCSWSNGGRAAGIGRRR